MTFEEVDQHVEKHVDAVAGNVDTASFQVCPAWQAVAPILGFVVAMPFFPAKWKALLQAFVTTMNTVCPPVPGK